MKCKIIICTLIKDGFDEILLGTTQFIENGMHYFNVPREDLTKWKDVRVKITIEDVKVGKGL